MGNTSSEMATVSNSENAPVIEISSIWRMFMDNMSLVKIDESQGGDILQYSLEGTREFYIVQERHVSSNRQISFLLHILHKIIAIYKQPEVQLDSNCFEQKNELFCKVWKSLTTTLCYLKDPYTHFQKFSQPLHQFLVYDFIIQPILLIVNR